MEFIRFHLLHAIDTGTRNRALVAAFAVGLATLSGVTGSVIALGPPLGPRVLLRI